MGAMPHGKLRIRQHVPHGLPPPHSIVGIQVVHLELGPGTVLSADDHFVVVEFAGGVIRTFNRQLFKI